MSFYDKDPNSKARSIVVTGYKVQISLKNICLVLTIVACIELILSRGSLTKRDPLEKFKYNDRPTQRMIELFQAQAPERRMELKRIFFQKLTTYPEFYEVLAPEIFCTELMRIGHVNDGGKWMCSPHNLPADCTILSLGLNNQISFDRYIQTITDKRCRVIGYDKDEQSEKTKQRMLAVNGTTNIGFIDSKDSADHHITLETIVNKHNISSIEILKMDVEGVEYHVLIPFLEKKLVPFPNQILIEVHTAMSAWQYMEIISALSRKGYLLSSFEILPSYQQLAEFSFVHESALARYNAHVLAKYLDIDQ